MAQSTWEKCEEIDIWPQKSCSVSWFSEIEADLNDQQPILPFSLTKWSNIIYGGRWWDFQDIKLRFMSGTHINLTTLLLFGQSSEFSEFSVKTLFAMRLPSTSINGSLSNCFKSSFNYINGYLNKTILIIINEAFDHYHEQYRYSEALN